MATATTSGTERSAELSRRARKVLPGGVNSNVRLLGAQIFFDRAAGAGCTAHSMSMSWKPPRR